MSDKEIALKLTEIYFQKLVTSAEFAKPEADKISCVLNVYRKMLESVAAESVS